MANRYTTQYTNCLQKGVNVVFAFVSFGAAGAPTIGKVNFNSEGLFSVTRNGTGLYTFVFGTLNNNKTSLDVYPSLLQVDHCWDEINNSGTAPLAPLKFITANNVAVPVGTANACSLQIQFTGYTGTATDPASGEAVRLAFWLKNSTAP
jgi:hypothetical protein